ncbi:hypothetical protein FMZ60_11935 [Alcaligenaceae bacterium SJ-26]|nr:hypothetical protein FMZ60_11935 [Alcaligenaceae bacterium SJ-26]
MEILDEVTKVDAAPSFGQKHQPVAGHLEFFICLVIHAQLKAQHPEKMIDMKLAAIDPPVFQEHQLEHVEKDMDIFVQPLPVIDLEQMAKTGQHQSGRIAVRLAQAKPADRPIRHTLLEQLEPSRQGLKTTSILRHRDLKKVLFIFPVDIGRKGRLPAPWVGEMSDLVEKSIRHHHVFPYVSRTSSSQACAAPDR